MVEGDRRRLGRAVIERIEEAGRGGSVLIHPMSIWEVGTLVRKGRLTLTVPVQDWVGRALALPGIFLLDLSPRSALEAALLPTGHPTDPVDRMLAAAARIEDAVLVTADRSILAFRREGGVRVLNAR
jgi:PIN domain nuclease of toxin-antitoxin system